MLKKISSGHKNIVTLHDYFEVRIRVHTIFCFLSFPFSPYPWSGSKPGTRGLYAQTSHNLYLCFDLCTGGELFDSICAKGHYYEALVPSPPLSLLSFTSHLLIPTPPSMTRQAYSYPFLVMPVIQRCSSPHPHHLRIRQVHPRLRNRPSRYVLPLSSDTADMTLSSFRPKTRKPPLSHQGPRCRHHDRRLRLKSCDGDG